MKLLNISVVRQRVQHSVDEFTQSKANVDRQTDRLEMNMIFHFG